MTYSEFLFCQLLLLYSQEHKDMPYDLLYEAIPDLYEEFCNSKFNDLINSEYDCILNYLSDKNDCN